MPYLSELQLRDTGLIYVVDFSNDEFKIGRSQDIRERSRTLRRWASSRGLALTRGWYSEEHANWKLSELRLLTFCIENFGEPTWGREVFRGNYQTALAYAQQITSAVEEAA